MSPYPSYREVAVIRLTETCAPSFCHSIIGNTVHLTISNMWKQASILAVWLCLTTSLVTAADIVYVTDLTIFTELAPCAASAVSYDIMSMTYSACPDGVTELQSCVCTKNNNFAAVQTKLSSWVSYSCGETASDDQASATAVYNAYCNQASITPFPKPTITVSQ
ncbi:hypothetical protein BJ170DRAFT_617921 [Xylariales sp. AK1849]|nr:hypothetical protein BJ170DRAFT_617921 [Xylariales sp. AK1849]